MATLICKTCGGNTEVASEAMRHSCEYCGAEIIVQATPEARSAAERAAREGLEEIADVTSALLDQARAALDRGDRETAEQIVRQKVEREGQVYQETGYYRIMGLDSVQAVATHHEWVVGCELDQLSGAPTEPEQRLYDEDSPSSQFAMAMASHDLDALLRAYPALCRAKMASDPEWQDRPEADLRDAIAHATEDLVCNLTWASPEDLLRYGYRVAQLQTEPDGSRSLTCGSCGVRLSLQAATDRVTCEHCSSITLVRLSLQEQYQAAGHSDLSPEDIATQEDAERWSAKQDLGALIRMAQRLVDGDEAAPGTRRAREVTFSNAVQIGEDRLSAGEIGAIAEQLGLAQPMACPACEQRIALDPGGDGHCPVCQTVVRRSSPKPAPRPEPTEGQAAEIAPAANKRWWQF